MTIYRYFGIRTFFTTCFPTGSLGDVSLNKCINLFFSRHAGCALRPGRDFRRLLSFSSVVCVHYYFSRFVFSFRWRRALPERAFLNSFPGTTVARTTHAPHARAHDKTTGKKPDDDDEGGRGKSTRSILEKKKNLNAVCVRVQVYFGRLFIFFLFFSLLRCRLRFRKRVNKPSLYTKTPPTPPRRVVSTCSSCTSANPILNFRTEFLCFHMHTHTHVYNSCFSPS